MSDPSDSSDSSPVAIERADTNELTTLPDTTPEESTLVNTVDSSSITRKVFPTLDGSETCPICYEPISLPLVNVPCYHLFCIICLLRWLNKTTTCPLCRTAVSSVLQKGDDEGYYFKIYIGSCNTNILVPSDEDQIMQRVNIVYGSPDGFLSPRLYAAMRSTRYEIYYNEYIRCQFEMCFQRNDAWDHDRVRKWIRRDVKAILNIGDGSRVEFVTNLLMAAAVYNQDTKISATERILSRPFVRVSAKYFGDMAIHFRNELMFFSDSGLTMEEYDQRTYYRSPLSDYH